MPEIGLVGEILGSLGRVCHVTEAIRQVDDFFLTLVKLPAED